MANKTLEEYQEERLKTLSEHMRAEERTLVVKPIPGKKTLSATGLLDSRIFTGEHKIQIHVDPFTNLWIFKYSQGTLPAKLKQKFTSYASIMKFAHDYFSKRNLMIEKVID